MLRVVNRFWRDERGIALILVSIMLPAIVGFALLAIDMSRANNLHNDLQKAADAFAIAAAAELDGRDDAITRADRAIANLVDNTYTFSTAGTSQLLTNAGISRRYLRSIPANDSDPIAAANVIADEVAGAVDAAYAEVSVNPTGFAAIFPASFLTGNAADNGFNTSATAVAGNAGPVVCDMIPIFICNPFPGSDLYEVANSGQFYNKGIKMVIGNTSWGPGNFGFLRPKSAHGYGENELAEDIAAGTVPECVSARRVYTQTGNLTTKAKAAFNTRFDLFAKGGGFPSNSDARWPPAPNVRKGFRMAPKGKNPGTDPCDVEFYSPTAPTQYRQMTTDTAFTGQIGNGVWDYAGYLDANGLIDTDMAGFLKPDGTPYRRTDSPPRYDLYKYEISAGLVDDPSLGGETGTPACSPNVGDADRRLIYAAVLDCSDPDVVSQLQGQSGEPPAIGFASFFLTEAVTGDVVYGEVVDIDGARGRGTMENFARDDVQLVR